MSTHRGFMLHPKSSSPNLGYNIAYPEDILCGSNWLLRPWRDADPSPPSSAVVMKG